MSSVYTCLQQAEELGVVVDVVLSKGRDEEVGVIVVLQSYVSAFLLRGIPARGRTSW